MRDKNWPNRDPNQGFLKWLKDGKNIGQSNKISYLLPKTWLIVKFDHMRHKMSHDEVFTFLSPIKPEAGHLRLQIAAICWYSHIVECLTCLFSIHFLIENFQTLPWRWMQRQQKRLKGKGDNKRARKTWRGEERGNRLKRVSLLLSSNLISCGSQCSAVQREGHNGSHLPSIITLLESSVMCSGWMITCPPHLASVHYHLCCSFVPQCRINAENAVEPPLCVHVMRNIQADGHSPIEVMARLSSLHEPLMLWNWVP